MPAELRHPSRLSLLRKVPGLHRHLPPALRLGTRIPSNTPTEAGRFGRRPAAPGLPRATFTEQWGGRLLCKCTTACFPASPHSHQVRAVGNLHVCLMHTVQCFLPLLVPTSTIFGPRFHHHSTTHQEQHSAGTTARRDKALSDQWAAATAHISLVLCLQDFRIT